MSATAGSGSTLAGRRHTPKDTKQGWRGRKKKKICEGCKEGEFRQVSRRSKTCLCYCSRCCGGWKLRSDVLEGACPWLLWTLTPADPWPDTRLDICAIQEKWKNRLVALKAFSFLSLYPNVMWIYGEKLENVVGRSKIRVRCASIRAEALTGPEPERRVQQTRQWEPDCIIIIE